MKSNLFLSALLPALAFGRSYVTGPDFGASGEVAPTATPVGTATSKEFSFFFRTDKIRDDEGKVIGTGRKHPDVKAPLPIPTAADVIAALQAGGKEAEYVMELLCGGVELAARQQINEWRDTNGLDKDFTATSFDVSKLSLTAIASTPKSERGGASISDEDWTAFLEDYTQTMVAVVGYEEKKVKLAVMHFKVQLRRIKNDKAAVQKLLDLLNIWASKSPNLEDHTACYTDLANRAAKYLKAEDKNLVEAL
jgi:hypothetical protein